MSRKKQRSLKQQAQSAQNLTQINAPGKENVIPKESLVPSSSLAAVIHLKEVEREQGDDYKRRLNNEHRKERRSKAQIERLRSEVVSSKTKLKEVAGDLADAHDELDEVQKGFDQLKECNNTLKHEKAALKKQKQRVPTRIALAVKKETTKVTTCSLREQGIISEPCREMIRDLVENGVPVDRVNDVIHSVCDSFSIIVPDKVSPRSVSRIVLEGGFAAKMQLVHEIINANCE